MATLENKNVNPVVALIANFCCFGILGYILLGQVTKGIFVLIVGMVLNILGGIGVVIWILGMIDAYQVAEAVASGQEVDENEYKFEILYKIMSLVHKDAVYKA